jgi:hypothetical protein
MYFVKSIPYKILFLCKININLELTKFVGGIVGELYHSPHDDVLERDSSPLQRTQRLRMTAKPIGPQED